VPVGTLRAAAYSCRSNDRRFPYTETRGGVGKIIAGANGCADRPGARERQLTPAHKAELPSAGQAIN
jgi:hypothetical protein